MIRKSCGIFILPLLIASLSGYGQGSGPHYFDSLLRQFQNRLDTNRLERVVVITDKNVYLAGDMIWLKAFCRNALSGRPVRYSNTIFVDIVNSDDSVVGAVLLDVKHQQTDGAIRLENKLPEGFYWVRGYTSEMATEDPGQMFVMPFFLVNSNQKGDGIRIIPQTPAPPPGKISPGPLMKSKEDSVLLLADIQVAAPDSSLLYTVIGVSAGNIYSAAAGKNRFSAAIHKNKFPSGPASLLLLDPDQNVLGSLPFQGTGRKPVANLSSNAEKFTSRSLVELNISVREPESGPVPSLLTVAVTEDAAFAGNEIPDSLRWVASDVPAPGDYEFVLAKRHSARSRMAGSSSADIVGDPAATNGQIRKAAVPAVRTAPALKKLFIPWMNSISALMTANRTRADEEFKTKNTGLLKEVVVTKKNRRPAGFDESKRISPFSFVLTADNLGNQEYNSLANSMFYIPGLHRVGGLMIFGAPGLLDTHEPMLIVDGVEVPYGRADVPGVTGESSPLMQYLNQLSQTPIAFIEALNGPSAALFGIRGASGVIIIHTRSESPEPVKEDSASLRSGSVSYYPALPFASPDYAKDLQKTRPDLRKTIFWQGTLLTDSSGRAQVKFYTADAKGTYAVIVAGVTARGEAIFLKKTITVVDDVAILKKNE